MVHSETTNKRQPHYLFRISSSQKCCAKTLTKLDEPCSSWRATQTSERLTPRVCVQVCSLSTPRRSAYQHAVHLCANTRTLCYLWQVLSSHQLSPRAGWKYGVRMCGPQVHRQATDHHYLYILGEADPCAPASGLATGVRRLATGGCGFPIICRTNR